MENEWTKRIKELEDEVAKLIADRDADRKREYGYSQQTVDALTAERDKLEAENRRLREALRYIAFTTPGPTMKTHSEAAEQSLKEASHEST